MTIKLTNSQEQYLRYFAGDRFAANGVRGNQATYEALRRHGLIEPTETFPYHAATKQGQAWLIAKDAS